jgi:hypothetical protein
MIAGTKVELRSEKASERAYRVEADGSGVYRFSGLTADDYILKLSSPGFKWLTVKSIRLSDGEQRSMPPLELEVGGACGGDPGFEYFRFLPTGGRMGSLGGSIRLDQGMMAGKSPPVAGAEVTLICSGGMVCRVTQSDSNGEFIFKSLPPGMFSLRINRAGFYPLEEHGFAVKEGRELIYSSVYIERCPEENCDPKLRPKKPLGICE